MENNSNRRFTRAMENARIEAIIAENRAAIANATTSTTTPESAPVTASSATLAPTSAPSSSIESSATPAPSPSDGPTTTIALSIKNPKASTKPSTSKTASKPSTSKAAGKKALVYNPDVDEETQEHIHVGQPPSRSASSPVDDDTQAHDRRRPTIKLRPPKTPEQQAVEDMARLALREGREDAVLESREHADERQGHAAYPDLPPEVPRDEEGIPINYYSRVDGKTQIWRAKK